jgi:hypothetical protein
LRRDPAFPIQEASDMSRRRIATTALFVLACTTAVSAATASAATADARASASKTRTLLATEMRSKESKTGFSWTDRVSEGGKAAGTDSGSCTFVKGAKRATCHATFRLIDGTIGVRGTVGPSGVFQLTIAGGTGAYAGVKGTGTAKPAGKSKSLVTLRLA